MDILKVAFAGHRRIEKVSDLEKKGNVKIIYI